MIMSAHRAKLAQLSHALDRSCTSGPAGCARTFLKNRRRMVACPAMAALVRDRKGRAKAPSYSFP